MDAAKAFKLFLEASQQGHPAAMNQLAISFQHGRAVAVDDAEAARWKLKLVRVGFAMCI